MGLKFARENCITLSISFYKTILQKSYILKKVIEIINLSQIYVTIIELLFQG